MGFWGFIGTALSALAFGFMGTWVERNYGAPWLIALAIFWLLGTIGYVLDIVQRKLEFIESRLLQREGGLYADPQDGRRR